MCLGPVLGVGYAAWPDGSGGYGLDAVSAGYSPETEGEIVSEDWSPAAREARAQAWREENAEATAEQNERHDKLLGLLRTWGPLGEGLDADTVDPSALPVGALEHICRQYVVELRATPE